MTDINLTPTLVDGEARIRDLDLAVKLEFAKPTKIRDLIARHRGALEAMGVLPIVGKTSGETDSTHISRNAYNDIVYPFDLDALQSHGALKFLESVFYSRFPHGFQQHVGDLRVDRTLVSLCSSLNRRLEIGGQSQPEMLLIFDHAASLAHFALAANDAICA